MSGRLEQILWITCFVLTLLMTVAESSAEAQENPGRDLSTIRLSDPELFHKMGSASTVIAGWLDSTRVADCRLTELAPGVVGCHGFSSRSVEVPLITVKRLLSFLPRCTWTRPAPDASLDCGFQFRGRKAWVDVGISIDSMSLILFTTADQPVKGTVPDELKAELAAIVAKIPMTTTPSRALRDKLISRWGMSIISPDTTLAPCECADATFFYYDAPPVIVQQTQPVIPAGLPPGPRSRGVILEVAVSKNGSPCAFKVGQGDPSLAVAAIAAVRNWVWKPAQSNNKAICTWIVLPIDF